MIRTHWNATKQLNHRRVDIYFEQCIKQDVTLSNLWTYDWIYCQITLGLIIFYVGLFSSRFSARVRHARWFLYHFSCFWLRICSATSTTTAVARDQVLNYICIRIGHTQSQRTGMVTTLSIETKRKIITDKLGETQKTSTSSI